MRRVAIVTAILLLAMNTADACHKYSVWKYPWRQSCRFSALAPPSIRSRARLQIVLPAPRPIEIPIPSLMDIDWGQVPDDDARGRLMLRATLQGKDDK